MDELKPRSDDIIIKKTHYSAFFDTKLKETLDRLGAGSVRLTGCLAHICVLFTAYEAAMNGYGVVVVKDGIADITPEDKEAAVRIMGNTLKVKFE